MKYAFLTLAVVSLLAPSVRSQQPVTYVDAQSTGFDGAPTGNTRYTNFFGFDDWVVRDRGIGGDLYQFRNADALDPDNPLPREIGTRITGLTPGVEYNFLVFFWDDTADPDWFIDASLQGEGAAATEFTNFSAGAVNNAAGPVVEAAELPIINLAEVNTSAALPSIPGAVNNINLTPGVSGNDTTRSDGAGTNQDLFAATIGSAVAPANGQVEVFIRNISFNNRVWYDGVGFQEVAGSVGDTNNDGNVDINDYNEIASRIGGPAVAPGSLGDVFGDGVIDLKDFSVWQQNRTDLGPGIAVPEPSAVGLISTLLLLNASGRRLREG